VNYTTLSQRYVTVSCLNTLIFTADDPESLLTRRVIKMQTILLFARPGSENLSFINQKYFNHEKKSDQVFVFNGCSFYSILFCLGADICKNKAAHAPGSGKAPATKWFACLGR